MTGVKVGHLVAVAEDDGTDVVRLLIDPYDDARRRWQRRVAAAAALVSAASSGSVPDVRHELRAEFDESPDLERDASAQATGATGVT